MNMRNRYEWKNESSEWRRGEAARQKRNMEKMIRKLNAQSYGSYLLKGPAAPSRPSPGWLRSGACACPPSVTEDELVKFIYAADDTASMASAARTARGYLAALSLGGAGLTPEFGLQVSLGYVVSGPLILRLDRPTHITHGRLYTAPW